MDAISPMLETGVFLAGLAQIALVLGSLAIPRILNWRGELLKVQPLIKQLFWTYAGYILCINLAFGLLSVFAVGDLLDGSFLATLLCGFIGLYWVSRLFIQFAYFDRACFPTGFFYKLGEASLVALFFFLSLVYGWAFYDNIQQL